MRIVLIEDSIPVRRAIAARLSQEDFLTVVGQASGLRDGVATAMLSSADVVLLDFSLSDGSGLQVLEQLRAANFGGFVFMLSVNPAEGYAFACRSSGANGYYDKSSEMDLLVEDLRTIAVGERAGARRQERVEAGRH